MEIAEYTYRLQNGQPIVTLAGKQYLLSTGAARSVGNAPVLLGRRDIDPRPSYQGITVANLRQRLGSQVAGMLGMDLLAPFAVHLYPGEHLLRLCPTCEIQGDTLPLEVVHGAPVFTVQAGGIGGRKMRLALDTSSALSLVPEPLLRHCETLGSRESYHPLVGSYRTPCYALDLAIDGTDRRFHAGVLPENLEAHLGRQRLDGILGADLLEHFGICLRLTRRMITLGPRNFGIAAAAGA